jgi:hypothetical protein
MEMQRCDYTSDDTGACVRELLVRIREHVQREISNGGTDTKIKVKVSVRRGDGSALMGPLLLSLPVGVSVTGDGLIPAAAAASVSRAKLDASVVVLVGKKTSSFSLHNVEKLTLPTPADAT